MKTKTLLIVIAFLFIGSTTQAQFFKKLGKAAENAAERAVIKKTEQKVSNETEKAMDTVLGNGPKKRKPSKKGQQDSNKNSNNTDTSENTANEAINLGSLGGFATQIDPSILPESYSYDWRYTLQMQHEKGAIDMHYHLRKDATDFATKIEMKQRSPMGGMLMVMDGERGVMAMLMEMNETKTGQLMDMNTDEIEAAAADDDMNDYEFKEIGTKTILGYTCQGYQLENEDMKVTMYVALNTPVSLTKAVMQDPKKMPKGFDPKWLDKIGENNLMMEMQMVHKKKKKHSATITCVALEKEPLTINIAEYKFGF